jgi:uncharacterized protein YndB with AHSA1/START domain
VTDGSRVLVAIRVPATPERAFTAFTDEIGQWWRPNDLFSFTVGLTGTLAFEPGPGGRLVETYDDGTTFTVGEVVAWEPPDRLALTWRTATFAPDQVTELEVTFTAVDDETRVVVEHVGWDRIPTEHAARHGWPLPAFQQRFAAWWQAQLVRLRATAGPT